MKELISPLKQKIITEEQKCQKGILRLQILVPDPKDVEKIISNICRDFKLILNVSREWIIKSLKLMIISLTR